MYSCECVFVEFLCNKIIHKKNTSINHPFTFEEVNHAIRKSKNNKTSGVDYIINEYVKYSPGFMIHEIVHLFNIILDTGIVPSEWSIGLICPIYKNKGDIKDPDNYRGITLLSCFSKIFSSCINSRLSFYLEENNLLGENQAGFRSGYSTLNHIFTLHLIIELYLHSHKRVYTVFIDYKKAFDFIERSSLWHKVLSHNINGKLFNVIHTMFSSAKACIKAKTQEGTCL